MFKADDYRLKIQGMRVILKEAEYALDIEHLRPRLAELEKEQENPDKEHFRLPRPDTHEGSVIYRRRRRD